MLQVASLERKYFLAKALEQKQKKNPLGPINSKPRKFRIRSQASKYPSQVSSGKQKRFFAYFIFYKI